MFLHNSCMGYIISWIDTQDSYEGDGGFISWSDNQESQRERAIVSWPIVQRHLVCTNSKCSLADKLGISTFCEIIVNTKCELFKLVLIQPTGKLRVILNKTMRLVLGTSFLGYESSWVRVVLGTSRLGYELSWVRVVLGTSRLGYDLSWVRVVLGTNCLGYELFWVRVVHNPSIIA